MIRLQLAVTILCAAVLLAGCASTGSGDQPASEVVTSPGGSGPSIGAEPDSGGPDASGTEADATDGGAHVSSSDWWDAAVADSGTVRRDVVPSESFTVAMRRDAVMVTAVLSAIDRWTAATELGGSVRVDPVLPGGVIAVDATADFGSVPCVSTTVVITGNAIFCPTDRSVVYDASALIPVLLDRHGPGAVVATFAHEYGHALQAASSSGPALIGEARADCFAGVVAAAVERDAIEGLTLAAPEVQQMVSPLIDFAQNSAADIPADTFDAHGTATQRVQWFATGYRAGWAACADLQPEASSTDQPALGVELSRHLLLTASEDSVAEFFGPQRGRIPTPATWDLAEPWGPFAQAATFAVTAGDGDACLVGAWVKNAVHRAADAESAVSVEVPILGAIPGAADAALHTVLLDSTTPLSDALAYLDGLTDGRASCG